MQYADAMSLFSFRYPMGWVYAPEKSSTGAVILEHFNPQHGTLRVDVFPKSSELSAESSAWSAAMGAILSSRLATDVTLRLLPDDEVAVGIERGRSDQQKRRLVAFRGHKADAAVTVESTHGYEEPFMIDTIRLVRSSFRRHVIEADPADMAQQFLGLVWDDWDRGNLPKTRNIIGAVQAVRAKAVAAVAPEPLFDMAVLLDQQLNAVLAISGSDHPEARLLQRQIVEIRGEIAGIFKAVGLPEPPLGDPAHVARACSELILHWHAVTGRHTPLQTTVLHSRALADLLTYARSAGSTLRHLWAVMTPSKRSKTADGDISMEVAEGLGYISSVLADASFDVGERADCHEADSLASAALRLLLAQSPDATLGGSPVRTQLSYRLLATSIHRRADQDPLSIQEANRLRAEVGAIGPSEELAKIASREDQQVALDNVMLLPNIPEDDPVAEPMTHSRWAQLWFTLGNEKDAVTELDKAKSQLKRLSRHRGQVPDRLGQIGSIYVDLADLCYRLGRSGEALQLLEQALKHTEPFISTFSFSLMRVASHIYQDADPALATRWADGAAVIADGLRLSTRPGEDRVRFADSALIQESYHEAIGGHLRQEDLCGAISMADRSRGRFLFEGLGSSDKSISVVDRFSTEMLAYAAPPPPAAGGPTNARLSIESVAEALGGPTASIPRGLARDLDSLRSAVVDAVTRECALTRTPVALSPTRIAGMSLYLRYVLVIQELGDDLILFLLGADNTPPAHELGEVKKFVLSEGSIRHIRIPGCRQRLLDAVGVIQQSMRIHGTTRGPADAGGTSTREALSSALAVLSELIIKPVSPYLGSAASLTIIPSRELGLVPWGLLTEPGGGFVLDRYDIAIVPSLSILHMLFERAMRAVPVQFRAYIAADPVLDDRQRARGFGELPFARQEAQALWSRLESLGAGPHVRREGPDATATSYWHEAEGAALVHLAAHAELADPAESSVIHLGGGGLFAYEVADVPLSKAIVFLAACDTGQGRISADGVLGLGQNFLRAGAQAVILTLTKVIDAVTAAVADHFYEALLDRSRNLTAASALRLAILATRSDLEAGRVIQDGEVVPPDPAYWGAFYVLGHPDTRLSFGDAEGA